MTESPGVIRETTGIPLHETASAKVNQLSDKYSELLIAQAMIIAVQSDAVQVSAAHVERAYHTLRLAPSSGRMEAAKLFSGALFGAGMSVIAMGLQAAPVIVWLTILGIAASMLGVGMMAWIAVDRR